MEKTWFSSYPQGIVHDIDLPVGISLGAFFVSACDQFAHCIAYEHQGRSLRFSELHYSAVCFAAFCQQKLGLQKGDVIALMLPNGLQYPIALFGAWLAGLTVMNLNPLYTTDELLGQVSQSDVRCIIVLENFAHKIMQVKKTCHVPHVMVTAFGDLFHFPKSFLMNSIIKYVKRLVPAYKIPNQISFKTVLHQGAECVLAPVSMTGDEVALLQPTGGTTGVPKLAMITHYNLLANLEQLHAWVKMVIVEGHERILTALPMYHIFSLTVRIPAGSLMTGIREEICSKSQVLSKYCWSKGGSLRIKITSTSFSKRVFCFLMIKGFVAF